MSTITGHALAWNLPKRSHWPRWLQHLDLELSAVTWHDLQRERRIEALMRLYMQEINHDPEEAQRLRNELEAAMRNCRPEFTQAVKKQRREKQPFISWKKAQP